MSSLKLEIRDGQTAFRPGDEVVGTASWQLERAPRELEVRLFWRTEGKGTQDVHIADTVRYADAAASEQREFLLVVPRGPFSFSGSLISLIWAIEAVATHPAATARAGIVVSPTGAEIEL